MGWTSWEKAFCHKQDLQFSMQTPDLPKGDQKHSLAFFISFFLLESPTSSWCRFFMASSHSRRCSSTSWSLSLLKDVCQKQQDDEDHNTLDVNPVQLFVRQFTELYPSFSDLKRKRSNMPPCIILWDYPKSKGWHYNHDWRDYYDAGICDTYLGFYKLPECLRNCLQTCIVLSLQLLIHIVAAAFFFKLSTRYPCSSLSTWYPGSLQQT